MLKEAKEMCERENGINYSRKQLNEYRKIIKVKTEGMKVQPDTFT